MGLLRQGFLFTSLLLLTGTPTLSQEYGGCFMVNSQGRVISLDNICPGDAAIELQQEAIKTENPLVLLSSVVEPDTNLPRIAHIRMRFKNRSDSPLKLENVTVQVKDISFGIPENLGTVFILEYTTLEPGETIVVHELITITQVGAESNQDLGVDLVDLEYSQV